MEAVAKIKTLKNKLWKLTSEYVRRKDADDLGMVKCYTCSRIFHYKEVDAGHGIPGRSNSVLFDLNLIRCQCRLCNRFEHGQQWIFGQKLDIEYGEGFFEQALRNARSPVKLYISDYDERIEAMTNMLKDLEHN